MYWAAISSQSPAEREEKWLSLLNHIVHVHKDNKLFKKCVHETIERQWLETGIMTDIVSFVLKIINLLNVK